MIHSEKQNKLLRSYPGDIKTSTPDDYQTSSKKNIKSGIARRKVEALIEQQELNKTLGLLWD